MSIVQEHSTSAMTSQQSDKQLSTPPATTNKQQQHPAAVAMSSILPQLSVLPLPPHQCKDLAPVFNVHNATRRSTLGIAAYLASLDAQTATATEIRDAANGCRDWVSWYMPHLHHHHQMEDVYWFPAYRKVLIDAGVPAVDVNTVFDRWEADHAALDQHERDMTRDLDAATKIKDDMTREQLQAILSATQQSSDGFAQFIHTHLSSEEAYWVDQLITQNRITDKQAKTLADEFAKKHLKKMKPKELGAALAFMMSPLGKEQEQTALKGFLPLPVRCYYNWFARSSYMKQAPRLYLIAHGHLTV